MIKSVSCKLSLLSACTVLLSSCAIPFCPAPAPEVERSTPPAGMLTLPTVQLPPNAGHLDLPLDLAWKNIQANAKLGAYRIVGVRPFPYTINLRLTGDPQRYIDCGMITVPESPTSQATQFPGAKSSQDYRILIKQIPYQVKRRIALEIQATVRLDPYGNQTYYWVEADYHVTREQNATSNRGPAIKARDTIHFRNNEEAVFKNAPTRCKSSDQLSADIGTWLSGNHNADVPNAKVLSASN